MKSLPIAVKIPLIGDVDLPSIKDLVGDVAGAPFKWLLDVLHNWFIDLVVMFEKEYVDPPAAKLGAWTDYMYGNTMNLAKYLAVVAFGAGFVWAMMPGQMKRLPRVLGVAFGMVLIPPMYFLGADAVKVLGDEFSRAMAGLYTPAAKLASQPLLLVPIVDNPLGAFAGMIGVVIFGGTLLGIFITYSFIQIAVTLLLLPFFALSALFDWALKVTNWLVSIFLVSALLGRPLALALLKVGEASADNIDQLNNTYGATIMIVGALIFGIVLQIVLVVLCHKMVSPVLGSIYSRGNTRILGGKVKAEMTNRRKSTDHRRKAYSRTFLGRRGAHGPTGPQPAGSGSTKRQLARNGAVMLAKRYPATALVATAATSVQKKPKQPAAGGQALRSSPNGRSDVKSIPVPPRGGSSGGSDNRPRPS